ncbi:hypothetical protein H2248_005785 [Termitomyces sp. 'cryptogamus']|nr:hypothetical protein H2248_005785 [Termitomyces sp. 'cryptogamus']
MVPRKFLSLVYGGGLQCAWANVAEETQKKLNNHKYPAFLYLTLDLNCHAPEMPGSPGLYFDAGCGGVAYPINGIHRLITRIARTPRGPVWQYQGQYKLSPSNPLTTQEWASVDSSVRMNWAEEIWKSAEWGKAARVRISLRRSLGRSCTDEEFDEAFNTKCDYRMITADDIAQALLRGEEVCRRSSRTLLVEMPTCDYIKSVAVWTMKCVGYDAEFQRDLSAKYANWTPPPKQKKKGKSSNKTKGKMRPKHKDSKTEREHRRTGQKRKRAAYSDNDSDELSADQSRDQDAEEDEEELDEYYYRPRGTRSRPIVIA